MGAERQNAGPYEERRKAKSYQHSVYSSFILVCGSRRTFFVCFFETTKHKHYVDENDVSYSF